jgi:hypothetical protein
MNTSFNEECGFTSIKLTDQRDITEILVKMALNTMTLTYMCRDDIMRDKHINTIGKREITLIIMYDYHRGTYKF